MSSQVPIPIDVPLVPTETYGEKFKRKFKEQPLVPIGAAVTIFTLTAAAVRMRQGRAKDMNNWLRARVLAQGFTVAAIVAGSWLLGKNQDNPEEQAKANREQEVLIERAGFEARMRAAEEAHAIETGQKSAAEAGAEGKGKGKGGWFGWASEGAKAEKEQRTSEAAVPIVAASTTVAGSSPLPASVEKKQESATSKGGILEKLGLSGPSKS